MEFHFDCVFYYVDDMERSVAFYSNVLGLRLSSRDAVARFDIDGVLFELCPRPEGERLEGAGNARLVLKVQDIAEAAEFLKAKAVGVSQVRDVENGRLATFNDPDGNEVCLWQYY